MKLLEMSLNFLKLLAVRANLRRSDVLIGGFFARDDNLDQISFSYGFETAEAQRRSKVKSGTYTSIQKV